ncbi:hypothetical protein HFC70_08755 [Agrobacterium sp. a22-2]|nr:hypothetical protein [Agrobacterium sp. a22-2]
MARFEARFVTARASQVKPCLDCSARLKSLSKALANVLFLIKAVTNSTFSACFSTAFSEFIRFASIIGINT